MELSLSKNSDVPLRQQLAEQIVILITTGQLQAGQKLPSVRALARLVKVHHNTVSQAYQDLVRRQWLTRQPGSRLIVGAHAASKPKSPTNLDELINESIERARQMGYSLQALSERVRDRLLSQPPDHILVIEHEPGLREIIRREVHQKLGWPVESCSPEDFMKKPERAVGAQVFAPNHLIEELAPLIPRNRPPVSITYSSAEQHVALIRALAKPSIIAAVSLSESLLKTARGFFAPAIGRRHTFREILLLPGRRADVRSADVVFCDSLAMSAVRSPRKLHYQLVSTNCLESLASAIEPARK